MPREYVLKTPPTKDNAPAFVRRAMTWAKATNELHGLIRGILADGSVSKAEAEFMKSWFAGNPDTLNDRLVASLAHRIDRVFEDGVVTDDELSDLRMLFSEYIGNREEGTPTPLPLSNPAPAVEIPERYFCFTGTFASGTRAWCHEQTRLRGGDTMDRVIAGLHVLVIGSQVSAAWVNQSYGRKIEAAVALRDSNLSKIGLHLPMIVAEDHWLAEVARSDSARSTASTLPNQTHS